MFAPLEGIRVIDLTHVLAGPYCTHLLAVLGAEVIKVEPPETGDLTRFGGPFDDLNAERLGLGFCTQNSDKASVTVNLQTPAGVEIVRRLAGGAQVVVENFRPGVAERLGVGFEAMVAANPELVYLSLTAYGQDGPLGHRPAYDHVVQAMSGIMETTGTDQTGPIKVGAPFVDYAAGLKGALAVMAALAEQQRTAQPQRVDVAMLDTTLLTMANTLTTTANTGARPPKLGNEAASLAASSGTFGTADGLLAIAANNDRQFRHLCQAIGRPELADDQRFASHHHRQANADAFRQELVPALAQASAAEWEERLDQVGVPAARVRSLDQLLAEGQPAARQLLTPVEVGTRTVELPTAGFKVNGEVPGPRQAPPRLGADTDRVLGELGYDRDEIRSLARDGVI